MAAASATRRARHAALPAAPADEVAPRRTSNARAGGRSARVVAAVLATTLEVLGESGWDGLRVDEVARRAGVNKTTVYRRWPTKEALVCDALVAAKPPDPAPTGDPRADLLGQFNASAAWLQSPLGRGIARMLVRADFDGAMREHIAAMREALVGRRAAILDLAVARGDLPAGTDTRLVIETIQASIHARIVRWGETVDPPLVAAIVDLVLDGARSGGAVWSGRRRSGGDGAG